MSLTTCQVSGEVSQIWCRRKFALLLPTLISLAPQRTGFLESPAANEIAWIFGSAEMHVKEQGLVKLRIQGLPCKGFTARFLPQPSLSCRNLARVEVQRHCSGLISLSRILSAPSSPELRGFDWSSMTLLFKRHPRDVCLCLFYLQYGHCGS